MIAELPNISRLADGVGGCFRHGILVRISCGNGGALRSYYTSGVMLHRPDEKRPERLLIFELRNGPELPPKMITRTARGWEKVENYAARLVFKEQGERQDAERLRKTDAIIRLIYEQAQTGQIYTANQFAETFENKEGLGSSRTIRERLSVLSTKGHIKFFKNADVYGLPLLARSRQPLYPTAGGDRETDRSLHASHKPVMEFLWPPNPSDTIGWERYLSCWPHLEPAVRRSTDGLAYRVDRLRLCGNGVVPLVAAYAFRTLASLARINI